MATVVNSAVIANLSGFRVDDDQPLKVSVFEKDSEQGPSVQGDDTANMKTSVNDSDRWSAVPFQGWWVWDQRQVIEVK